MRGSTRAKRERGYGAYVELPAAIYGQGVILGLLDAYQETIYYVLPREAEDRGGNYVRCKRWRPDARVYVPGVLKVWNRWEEAAEPIPEAEAGRVACFGRGMIVQPEYERVMTGRGEAAQETRSGQLLVHYANALIRRIEKSRNWNWSLSAYVLTETQHGWMSDLVASGVFDLMIQGHERMFTALDSRDEVTE